MDAFETAMVVIASVSLIVMIVWITGPLLESHEKIMKDEYIPKHISKKDLKKYFGKKKGK